MNPNNKQLSKCCSAPIITAHGCDADFGHGGKKCDCKIVTMWWECTKCEKPCDVEQSRSFFDMSDKEKKEIIETAAKESNRIQQEMIHATCRRKDHEHLKQPHVHDASYVRGPIGTVVSPAPVEWEGRFDDKFSMPLVFQHEDGTTGIKDRRDQVRSFIRTLLSEVVDKEEGIDEEAMESIASVVKATMRFIEGKIGFEEREEIYDKHMAFILSEREKAKREERERIKNIIHARKVEWHKTCLQDQFVNGRFWEAQELWEKLNEYALENK